MLRVLIASAFWAGAFLVGPFAELTSASARHSYAYPPDEAPWCAVISLGRGSEYWDCRYATIEACRPNVLAGNRGVCSTNPRWPGWAKQVEGPTERAYRHWRRR